MTSKDTAIMNSADLDLILISPNRQRQSFDDTYIQTLADAIIKNGLLHPPVVRQEDNTLVLVAGEQRLRALKLVLLLEGHVKHAGELFQAPNVPYSLIGELSELEAEEAELSENLHRRDLTWSETAAAHSRLHALRQKQGEQLPSTPTSSPFIQSVTATANELAGGEARADIRDKVRRELIVAKHLDNPEVAKSKTLDEAYKLLVATQKRASNTAHAERIGKSLTASRHKLFNADCLLWMRAHIDTPDSPRFDVICTDPPYGMNAQNFGDGGGKLVGIAHSYDDSPEHWEKLMSAWAPLSYEIAAKEAHAYVFCDFDKFHTLKTHMQLAGWYVFRTPFVIAKENSGRVPLPDRGPRRTYELCLYAIKGEKKVNQIYPDVIPCKGDKAETHGAQKPVFLYENLLTRSVSPGDFILDTFCGTGPAFPAGHTAHCTVYGVELDPSSYGVAAKRLEHLMTQDTLALF